METTNSGLYATHLYVRPNEASGYEATREKLLADLRPHGAFEESLALRIINANWRIHRCDAAETAIPVLASDGEADTIHNFAHPAQAAINRARAAAENTIRRTTKDLKELQAERWRRATLKLTGPVDPMELGLAPLKEAMCEIPTDAQRSRLLDRSLAIQKQNERNPELARPIVVPTAKPVARVVGRNSPCPCGSGQKYKRCCGGCNAAPLYQAAA